MSDIKNLFNANKRMLLGGASESARVIGVDVVFIRLAFAFAFLVVEWEPTLIAYALVSAAFYFANRKEIPEAGRVRSRKRRNPLGRAEHGSVHDARTKLDSRDRRMMAIDHHLASENSDQLAREIEALRAKVDAKKADEAKAAKGAKIKSEGDEQ